VQVLRSGVLGLLFVIAFASATPGLAADKREPKLGGVTDAQLREGTAARSPPRAHAIAIANSS
jgi:hypothetical protein